MASDHLRSWSVTLGRFAPIVHARQAPLHRNKQISVAIAPTRPAIAEVWEHFSLRAKDLSRRMPYRPATRRSASPVQVQAAETQLLSKDSRPW